MLPTTAYDDTALLEKLQTGDENALAQLYGQYAEPLTAFAAARLSSLEEARDIIQDIFVHLWQERATITIKQSMRAFLYAAVRYRIIDHIRKNSTRRKYQQQIAHLPTITLSTEELLYARQLESELHQAIEELSPRIREIFKLSRFEHLNFAQIAQKLGLSEQTVRNQLTTALSQLRIKLDKLSFLLWWF